MKNSSSQILILDTNLKLKHKFIFNERVAFNKLLNIKEDLFINTTSSIFSYNMKSGEKNWEFEKEKTILVKTSKGFKFRGTDIHAIDKSFILLTEGTYEDGYEEITDVILKIIEPKTKKIVQTINTKISFKGKLVVKNLKRDLILFSNNKILSYEKL